MFARKLAVGALAGVCLLVPGCEPGENTAASTTSKDKASTSAASAKPAPPAKSAPAAKLAPVAAPPGTPGPVTPAVGANIEGTTLKLEGLEMTIPKGWMPEGSQPGPMAPRAVFRLGGVADDPNGCAVRVTHFPGMKGMDRQNIDRWISQVRQPDGTPSTRENAEITTKENGSVRLTIVDLSGSVNTSMNGQGSGKPDFRLIAAIVDHPLGPHFVKAWGKSKSMARWQGSIREFLESAKAQ